MDTKQPSFRAPSRENSLTKYSYSKPDSYVASESKDPEMAVADMGPIPPFYMPSHDDHKKLNLQKWLVRAVMFFYMLSIMVLTTTKTQILREVCHFSRSRTSEFLGNAGFVERVSQFFLSPFIGKISDSYGRRPVLLWSFGVHWLAVLLMATIPGAATTFSYFALHAVCGTYSMMNAMVIDWTFRSPPREGALVQQYGRLALASGVGLVLGPIVGSHLGQQINVILPVWVALGCVSMCLIITLVMDESLPVNKRTPFTWKGTNPFTSLRDAWKYPSFTWFVVPFVFSNVAECVYHSFLLYTQQRLNWTYINFGYYASATGTMVAIMMGSIKYLIPRYLSDTTCVPLGLTSHGIGLFIAGLANKAWVIGVAAVPTVIGSMKQPGLQSIMSYGVSASEQGVLQGSIISLRTLSKAIGEEMFGAVMAYALEDSVIAAKGEIITGLPFFVASALEFTALATAGIAIWCYVIKGQYQAEKKKKKPIKYTPSATADISMQSTESLPPAGPIVTGLTALPSS